MKKKKLKWWVGRRRSMRLFILRQQLSLLLLILVFPFLLHLLDSGVTGLFRFFSRWLLWAITLTFTLSQEAAIKVGSGHDVVMIEQLRYLIPSFFLSHFL
ncbi:hypothetical protein O6P43_010555 [Quillaja saponaria]|uniref:Uncharacterized protein n=1 Tax=Quillaja saponaria TaxID=32244 RepID=A0AAD7Q0P6_QUISA|nr:hypothetical protein O6P43_010555 [Quillaja saponaria]